MDSGSSFYSTNNPSSSPSGSPQRDRQSLSGSESPALSSSSMEGGSPEVATPTARLSGRLFKTLRLQRSSTATSEQTLSPKNVVRSISSSEILKEQVTSKDEVLEKAEANLLAEAGAEVAALVADVGTQIDAYVEKQLALTSKQSSDAGWWNKAVSSVKLRGLRSLLTTFHTPQLFKRLVTTLMSNLVHQAALSNAANEQERVNCHDLVSLSGFFYDRVNGELGKVAEASARVYLARQSSKPQQHRNVEMELKEALDNEAVAIDRAADALYRLVLPNGSRDLHPNKHIANFMALYLKRKIKQIVTDYADYKKREMGEKFKPGHLAALKRAQGATKEWIETAANLFLKNEQIDRYAETAAKRLHPRDQDPPEGEVNLLKTQFHAVAAALKSSGVVQEMLLPWALRFQVVGHPLDNAILCSYRFLNGEAAYLNSALAEDRASPPENGKEGALSKVFAPFVAELLEAVGLGVKEWPLPYIFEKMARNALVGPLASAFASNYSLWNLPSFLLMNTMTDQDLLEAYVANQGVQKALGSEGIAACSHLAQESVVVLLEKGGKAVGLPKQALDVPHIKEVVYSIVFQFIVNAAVNATEGQEGLKSAELIVQGIAKKVAEIVKNYAAAEGNRENLDRLLREAGQLMNQKKQIQADDKEGIKQIEEKLSKVRAELVVVLKPLGNELGKLVSECPQGAPLFGMIPFNKLLKAQWENIINNGLAEVAMTKLASHWALERTTMESRTAALQQDQKAKEACQRAAENISVTLPSYIQVKGDSLADQAFEEVLKMLVEELGNDSCLVIALRNHPEQTKAFLKKALVGITSDPFFQTVAKGEIAKHIEFVALPALKRIQELDKEGEATFLSQLAQGVAQKAKEHLHVINERRAQEMKDAVQGIGTVDDLFEPEEVNPSAKPAAIEKRQEESFDRAATVALSLAGIRKASDLGLPSPIGETAYKNLHDAVSEKCKNTFLKLADPKVIKEKVYQSITGTSKTAADLSPDVRLVDVGVVKGLTAEIVEFLPATWTKMFLGTEFAQQKVANETVKAISKQIWKHRDLHQTLLDSISGIDIKPEQEATKPSISTEQINAELENHMRAEIVDSMAKHMNKLWAEETVSTAVADEQLTPVVSDVGQSITAGWLASTFAFMGNVMTNVVNTARDKLISTGAGMASSDADALMQSLHYEEHRELFFTLFDEAITLLERQLKLEDK